MLRDPELDPDYRLGDEGMVGLAKLPLPSIIRVSMIWSRAVLALAFLIATILGNAALLSAMADTSNSMEMAMSASPSMSKDCSACDETSSATKECSTVVCSVSAALPLLHWQRLNSVRLAFGRPADQRSQRPIYSPDPHPPKFSLLT
jgi:hypothetical protein